MGTRFTLATFFSLLLCAACGAEKDDTPVTSAPEVVGGRAESGFPAVGYLAVGYGADDLHGPNCGATLISSKLAVTAAHCIAYASGNKFGIGFGDAGSGRIYPAQRVFTHPEYQRDGFQRYRHDIAVLVLEEAPPVEPARVLQDAPQTSGVVQYVGYGRTTPGDYSRRDGFTNERKSADMRVTASDGLSIFTTGIDGGLCWGDSGGPILENGYVSGVLADFDGIFECAVGNKMIFTSVIGEAAFMTSAIACADSDDGACLLQTYQSLRGDNGGGSASCATTCTAYHYAEGQCSAGWRCQNGCLVQDETCRHCQIGCAQYGYQEGQCSNGWRCTNGCLSADSSCTPACTYACNRYGWNEGQCFQGWLCQDGCLSQTPACN